MLNEVDWENRSEWHLQADKLDELANSIEKSGVTGISNGVRDIRIVQRLVESTRNLANYYRSISDNIVS